MKKIPFITGVLLLFFLGGCSLLSGVSESLDYANDAKNYIQTASSFAEEVPQLAEEAVSNEEARVELESKLSDMKKEIQQFNETTPPTIAEDLHQQLVDYNQKLEDGIDLYLTNIEDGKVDPKLLEDSQILQTISQITSILDQIEQLGS